MNIDISNIHGDALDKLLPISRDYIPLSQLISKLENEEIILISDLPKHQNLWSVEQKSQLIESLLMGIPLTIFFFDGSDPENWIVIDGSQRLQVLKEFFLDKTLILSGMEFLHDLNGKYVDELPRPYIRKMMETQLDAYVIRPGTPTQLKYSIVNRLNGSGINLKPQEIRHILFHGHAASFLESLADLEIFKKATNYAIPSDRMMDRELILRFIAFSELPVEEYHDSMEEFLNTAMEYINQQETPFFERVTERFIQSITANMNIFDVFAFRRLSDTHKKTPFNKSLFETWTVILSQYDDADIHVLIDMRQQLCENFIKICKENEFLSNLSGQSKEDVMNRYLTIRDLVNHVLHHPEK